MEAGDQTKKDSNSDSRQSGPQKAKSTSKVLLGAALFILISSIVIAIILSNGPGDMAGVWIGLMPIGIMIAGILSFIGWVYSSKARTLEIESSMPKGWFGTSMWLAKLPNNWISRLGGDCSTLYNMDKGGILQICAEIKIEATESDLMEFVKDQLEIGIKPKKVKYTNLSGIKIEYTGDREYGCEWYLKSSDIIFLIKYDCDIKNKGLENSVINTLLNSLKARDVSGEMNQL